MEMGSAPPRRGGLLGTVSRRAAWLSGEGVALGWMVSERLADGVVRVVRGGRRLMSRRSSDVGRRLRRRDRRPLANLYQVHPEARQAAAREVGLRSIALEDIAGTAVAGATQRGSDFLPLPAFRSPNWRARWRRIRAANDRLQILPPIDLVKFDGRYWVTDGHNRVAVARRTGQVEIDAVVTALVPLGRSLDERPASLAEIVADSRAVRAAGSGRWTRSASPAAIDEASSVLDTTAAPTERPGDER